jgi:2-dehydro-3-deoxy-L-rhamnonate dehydrogenase (NAD+)
VAFILNGGRRELTVAVLRNGYGRIVNVSSISGKEGNAGMPTYAAAKAGALGLTKAVGRELAQTGILVNAVTH